MRVRRVLREEVGVEPGRELRDLEAAVLSHDARRWTGTHARRALGASSPTRARRPAFRGEPPPVQYVKGSDGISLAYQVAGDGPSDLIIVPGYISELDNWWEAWAGRLVRRLASFSRLILFDKRGVGLADRPERITIQDWVEDTRTVLDAVGSERPAVLGMSGGGAVAMLFAATYPERTGPLITYGASPRSLAARPTTRRRARTNRPKRSSPASKRRGERASRCASGVRASVTTKRFAPSSVSTNGARRVRDQRAGTCGWS